MVKKSISCQEGGEKKRLSWAAAADRAGQGRTGQVAHPSRQLTAAFALGSQGVAVNHHPLDLELAKEIKIM